MQYRNFPGWDFELNCWTKGFNFVAGIDEAGRGPLAGPVVAAAVILQPNIEISGINDSKKLSPKKREEIFNIIQEKSIDIGIGIISEKIIDEINILQATILAMQEAVLSLSHQKPDFLLIDGLEIKKFPIPNKKIIRGDSLSVSIASASIIAKVTRDRIMEKLDINYPEYSFREHKGYGTKKHCEAIARFGVTDIHRKTFCRVKEYVK
ncbi:MAG: ribonuclease HII [Candidatus Firestonebacteria bacterium]|nr:ribonuclease HII [Candidatus Firestonebacteria bacterium]